MIDGDENRDKRMHCTFNILVSLINNFDSYLPFNTAHRVASSIEMLCINIKVISAGPLCLSVSKV